MASKKGLNKLEKRHSHSNRKTKFNKRIERFVVVKDSRDREGAVYAGRCNNLRFEEGSTIRCRMVWYLLYDTPSLINSKIQQQLAASVEWKFIKKIHITTPIFLLLFQPLLNTPLLNCHPSLCSLSTQSHAASFRELIPALNIFVCQTKHLSVPPPPITTWAREKHSMDKSRTPLCLASSTWPKPPQSPNNLPLPTSTAL